MIVGRFDEQSGLPLIEGYLVLPRLQIFGYINFIMDTGADRTLLLPTDALSLGIDYEYFTATSNTIGIGGMAEVHEESVQLAFILTSAVERLGPLISLGSMSNLGTTRPGSGLPRGSASLRRFSR